MTHLTLEDLIAMTRTDGEDWALPHVRRVLCLAETIDQGLVYDHKALAIAAYLHDWGAFPRYLLVGVDHATRSRQVAQDEVLPLMDLGSERDALILDAIEQHDYRDPRDPSSGESLLLREADMLDMLGVIGMAREFAWGPNNLATCVKRIRSRMEGIAGRLSLRQAQEMAQVRLERMALCLGWLDEESSGIL